MSEITSEDVERIELLEIVSSSKTGLKLLSKEQLQRLYKLVENKDYSNNTKIEKSKKDLLEKINNRLYDIVDGRIIL
jgi:archaellum biogenesis protein FlaJ (TadC family)